MAVITFEAYNEAVLLLDGAMFEDQKVHRVPMSPLACNS